MHLGRSRRVAPRDASRAARTRPPGHPRPGRSAPAGALAALAAVTSAVSLSAAAVAGPLAPSGAIAVLDLPAAISAVAEERAGADAGGARGGDRAPHGDEVASSRPVTRYVVRDGDTVASAAVLHAVAPADLVAANDLEPPFEVAAGEVLEVPRRTDAPPLPAAIADHARLRGLLPAFATAAAAHDVPPELLMAVAWQESRWRDDDVSEDGAVGIAQLLPATADWVAGTLLDGEALDPRRTGDNLELSARYLRYLLDRAGGDQARALAAYYQGPASTDDGRWYDDTERYVRDVFALRWAFEAAVPEVP